MTGDNSFTRGKIMAKKTTLKRKTKETSIAVSLKINGKGKYSVRTPVPFFNHMLETFCRHGFFDVTLSARGDVHVDDHHLVEDTGLALGGAFAKVIGDKKGIRRFGESIVPLDEALVLASVDISGRPYLNYSLQPKLLRIKNFEVQLVEEFFRAFTSSLGCNLHLVQLSGKNTHHIVEAAFKAFAKALDMATQSEPRVRGVLSTKGAL